MPVFLLKLLPFISGFLWKAIKRFGSVLFVGLLIWTTYSYCHRKYDNFRITLINMGRTEQKSIDDAILAKWQKEHPQNVYGAGSQITQNACDKDFKAIGLYIFGFKLGI